MLLRPLEELPVFLLRLSTCALCHQLLICVTQLDGHAVSEQLCVQAERTDAARLT